MLQIPARIVPRPAGSATRCRRSGPAGAARGVSEREDRQVARRRRSPAACPAQRSPRARIGASCPAPRRARRGSGTRTAAGRARAGPRSGAPPRRSGGYGEVSASRRPPTRTRKPPEIATMTATTTRRKQRRSSDPRPARQRGGGAEAVMRDGDAAGLERREYSIEGAVLDRDPLQHQQSEQRTSPADRPRARRSRARRRRARRRPPRSWDGAASDTGRTRTSGAPGTTITRKVQADRATRIAHHFSAFASDEQRRRPIATTRGASPRHAPSAIIARNAPG